MTTRRSTRAAVLLAALLAGVAALASLLVDHAWRPHRSSTAAPDAQRDRFVRDLEAQYRRDYDDFAGSGRVAYGSATAEAHAERVIGVRSATP